MFQPFSRMHHKNICIYTTFLFVLFPRKTEERDQVHLGWLVYPSHKKKGWLIYLTAFKVSFPMSWVISSILSKSDCPPTVPDLKLIFGHLIILKNYIFSELLLCHQELKWAGSVIADALGTDMEQLLVGFKVKGHMDKPISHLNERDYETVQVLNSMLKKVLR